jgi:hypothetical protein
MLTSVNRGPSDRHRLIDRLVDEFALPAVAAAACAQAGIVGRETQVAYCVAVLARKRDPARRKKGEAVARRTYRLDLDDPGFPEQLAYWAGTIARNLSHWSERYETIHDDTERASFATLSRLMPRHRADDAIAMAIVDLSHVLTAGPRLEEMSLDLVRAFEPLGSDYVFSHPLDRWIRTAVRRRLPWDVDPLEDEDGEQRGLPRDASRQDVGDQLADDRFDEHWLRDEIRRLAALVQTRRPLDELAARVDRYERELGRVGLVNRDDDRRIIWLRAEMAHEVDRLLQERRMVTTMLAYIVLALPADSQIQRVATLGLRLEAIEPDVVEDFANRMRALLDDARHPAEQLVERTRRAGVARARARRLEQLRGAPERRGATLAPVARMLGELPPTVPGDDAIAPLVVKVKDIVKARNHIQTVRAGVADEVTSVDPVAGRVFRRYAMGKVA